VSKTNAYLKHIQSLLRDKKPPELHGKLAENPLLVQIHNDLMATRGAAHAICAWDISHPVGARGFIPGCLKHLQAGLRHLIWQVRQIHMGDFSREIPFMGEFSVAFNDMVSRLRWSHSELREKENSLKESEAHFKFLASHDHLTGCYNRRSFIELAEIKLIQAVDAFTPCCIALMDIDHFKVFNDTYGHLEGDCALRHAVKIVADGLRDEDFIGRYGGEEFIIFLYNADEAAGLKIVERLCKSLADNPVMLDAGFVTISASFGVAGNGTECENGKDCITKLIQNADTALYAAKNAGRNRAVPYNECEKQAIEIMSQTDIGEFCLA
jgi:diguanylate cyclase (GGDEF)-like protein